MAKHMLLRGMVVMTFALGLATLFPQKASADGIFGVFVAPKVGGAMGRGDKQTDFREWTSGGAAGFEAGLHLLFIGAYVEYLRFFGGSTEANLWSVNLGGDTEFRFGDHWGLVLRLAGAWYWGDMNDRTRRIDGLQVSSRAVDNQGIGFRGGIGPRYHFWKFLSVGVTPQFGYHYFFDGAETSGLTTGGTDSHGWDFQALGYIRFGLEI